MTELEIKQIKRKIRNADVPRRLFVRADGHVVSGRLERKPHPRKRLGKLTWRTVSYLDIMKALSE